MAHSQRVRSPQERRNGPRRLWLALVMAGFIAGSPTFYADPLVGSLWYNGDPAAASNPNYRNTLSSGQNSVYDDFIVPAGQVWTITTVYGNISTNSSIGGADWSIRTGLSTA